jgi:pimeloyl-ACP methyl ester carboxylesterase
VTIARLPAPHLLRLSDRRLLSWYEFGSADGVPCVYLPGTPESGLAGECYADSAESAGVRWISVDRPGYGHSDPHPGRSLVDTQDDVRQLLDHLDIDRAVVVGESGGGPHALAVAHGLGSRVPLLVLLAAMGPGDEPWVRHGMRPTNQVLFWLARLTPRALRGPMLLMSALTTLAERSPAFAARLSHGLPEPDRRATSRPEYRVRHLAGPDAFRQGATWAAEELALFARPWSFAVEDVTTPVHMWHGSQDVNVPISVARSMSRKLPTVTTHFSDDCAHAVGFERRAEVMGVITSAVAGRSTA